MENLATYSKKLKKVILPKSTGQSNVIICDLIFIDSLNRNLTPHNGTPASASTLSLIIKLSAAFIM